MCILLSRVLSLFSAVLSVAFYAPSSVRVAFFFSFLLCIILSNGNLWLGDENLAGGEAKEICLVIPGSGPGRIMPRSIFCCQYKTETLEMYAMLKKKKKTSVFLRRYY